MCQYLNVPSKLLVHPSLSTCRPGSFSSFPGCVTELDFARSRHSLGRHLQGTPQHMQQRTKYADNAMDTRASEPRRPATCLGLPSTNTLFSTGCCCPSAHFLFLAYTSSGPSGTTSFMATGLVVRALLGLLAQLLVCSVATPAGFTDDAQLCPNLPAHGPEVKTSLDSSSRMTEPLTDPEI